MKAHARTLSAELGSLVSADNFSDFLELSAFYEFMEERYWSEYEPTYTSSIAFEERIARWLGSALGSENRLSLYRSLKLLQYISSAEMDALCRAAFTEHIIPWLCKTDGIQLDALDYRERLQQAIGSAWFCPISDSMPIASFCHINTLTGRNFRPDWHSLALFGSLEMIQQHITRHRIRKLVLLEDFVGSGNQFLRALRFAEQLDSLVEILAVPLIVCPAGQRALTDHVAENPRLSLTSVLELNTEEFVLPQPGEGEAPSISELRRLVHATEREVRGTNARPVEPFGYRGTGATIVLFSNTPNNTLPIFHRQSDTWFPPFPRSSRQ